MFFKGSRYEHVADAEVQDERGRVVRYKKARFIPETEARMGHILNQGERLDLISHRYYQDPERFWRICDANLATWPDELVAEAGKTILVPPPEG
ncbi:MAG: hypothetical protein H0U55_16715 [Rubrobacteraceae bacterium]|nr:hypothetical protein [Rubrobacteraceae bacterium]